MDNQTFIISMLEIYAKRYTILALQEVWKSIYDHQVKVYGSPTDDYIYGFDAMKAAAELEINDAIHKLREEISSFFVNEVQK